MSAHRKYEAYMPRDQPAGALHTVMYHTATATVIFRVGTMDDARGLRAILNEIDADVEVRFDEAEPPRVAPIRDGKLV